MSIVPQVDEEIYHHQLLLIQKLLNSLTAIDMDQGNQGKLSKADFRFHITLSHTLGLEVLICHFVCSAILSVLQC